MARVALLITVLAAVVYISQAIPVPENVEDEQLKSKEIFDQIQPESKEILDQVQPESKEILDQVQPESKEILDQNQPKSEEILDQIQPKSEENLDQPDDTSENELEDSKNKDWHHHKENNLKQKLEKLEGILKEFEDNKWKNNQWKIKGIKKQIERIQQRTRRNSQYVPIDIANVNDIFTDLLKDAFSQVDLFVQNTLPTEMSEAFSQIINKISTLDKNEISENVKELKEKFEEYMTDEEKDFVENVVGKVQDIFKNFAEKLEDVKKIIENPELPNQEKVKDIFNIFNLKEKLFKIAKNTFKTFVNAKIKAALGVYKTIKKALKPKFDEIIELKIKTLKNAEQLIADAKTFVADEIQKGIKIITENDTINNIKEHFEDKMKEVIKESQVGKIVGNISKKVIENSPLNRFNDLSKGVLLKIKKD